MDKSRSWADCRRLFQMHMMQVLADAYDCSEAIVDESFLIESGRAAAEAVGAKIIGETTVRYVPHGLTIGLFLAESHLVLTTWPEYRLVLIDVLLCNPDMSPDTVIDALAARLCPRGRLVRHRVTRRIAADPA